MTYRCYEVYSSGRDGVFARWTYAATSRAAIDEQVQAMRDDQLSVDLIIEASADTMSFWLETALEKQKGRLTYLMGHGMTEDLYWTTVRSLQGQTTPPEPMPKRRLELQQ